MYVCGDGFRSEDSFQYFFLHNSAVLGATFLFWGKYMKEFL